MPVTTQAGSQAPMYRPTLSSSASLSDSRGSSCRVLATRLLHAGSGLLEALLRGRQQLLLLPHLLLRAQRRHQLQRCLPLLLCPAHRCGRVGVARAMSRQVAQTPQLSRSSHRWFWRCWRPAPPTSSLPGGGCCCCAASARLLPAALRCPAGRTAPAVHPCMHPSSAAAYQAAHQQQAAQAGGGGGAATICSRPGASWVMNGRGRWLGAGVAPARTRRPA